MHTVLLKVTALFYLVGALSYLHFVFTLNTEANRVMPSADVDRLHQIVRSARYRSTKNLRAYLERIRQKAELSASDRFSIRRLESLVGVIAA